MLEEKDPSAEAATASSGGDAPQSSSSSTSSGIESLSSNGDATSNWGQESALVNFLFSVSFSYSDMS